MLMSNKKKVLEKLDPPFLYSMLNYALIRKGEVNKNNYKINTTV